jgi:hypothetical protein
MSLLNNAPAPIGEPIAQRRRKGFKEGEDPLEGLIADPWADWYAQQQQTLETFAGRVGETVALTAQAASIAATDMSGGALSTGLYRISYYTRITQAASVSSSLDVTLDWQDGGVTVAFTGATIAGNTITSFQSYSLPLIFVDAASPVRYSTTYASAGLSAMNYSLYIVLEEVLA